MMEDFSQHAENPDTALHGLQTLMTYNEEQWFMDVQHAYGNRFYDHMLIQFVIARGLCRFGHYAEAELYCRKALVLGAGRQAEELLELCHRLSEKQSISPAEEIQHESQLRPLAFSIILTGSLLLSLFGAGISALRTHTLTLVSGTATPYTVRIDAQPRRMLPYSRQKMKLHPGKHSMQITDIPDCTNNLPFECSASILDRKHHHIVLNPDHLIRPTSGTPIRDDAIPPNLLENMRWIQANDNTTESAAYARRALMFEPDSEYAGELLAHAALYLPPEEAWSFFQRETRAPAIRLPWHLAYQDFAIANQKSDALQAEYAQRCKTSPENPLNYYLLGRIIPNRANAALLFRKSEEGTGCRGLGYYSLARDLLCSGKNSEALPWSEKALLQAPDRREFIELNMRIHLGLRHHHQLLQLVRQQRIRHPEDPEWTVLEIKYLTQFGEHHAAERIINNLPEDHMHTVESLQAAQFYAVGNIRDYLSSLSAAKAPDAELQKLLHTDRIPDAQNILSRNEDHAYTAHLIMYSAACRRNENSILETELSKALSELNGSPAEKQVITALLSGATTPTQKNLLELRIWPEEKAILCTALGFRFPQYKETCFRLARQFNYTPAYPQLLLKKWTAASPPSR